MDGRWKVVGAVLCTPTCARVRAADTSVAFFTDCVVDDADVVVLLTDLDRALLPRQPLPHMLRQSVAQLKASLKSRGLRRTGIVLVVF